VLAVTGRSAAVPEHDLADARRVAAALGVRHETVETRELELPEYRANRGDRCYHCRGELFGTLEELAKARGFAAVAYGAIADDAGDDRPGMAAARERGILAPLLEAGMGKGDVRAIAASRGLPVRDKPAAACLASRLPVGTEVTAARLARVEKAESALRALGLGTVRVRDHGEIGRVELDAAGLERIADPELRRAVADAVRGAGFRFAAVDLDGYRVGGGVGRSRETPLYRIGPQPDGGQ